MAVSARLTFLEEYGGNVEVIQVLSWFDLNFVIDKSPFKEITNLVQGSAGDKFNMEILVLVLKMYLHNRILKFIINTESHT